MYVTNAMKTLINKGGIDMTIMYPFKFIGRFEDNKGDWTEIITYSSFSESDCIQQLIDLQDKYGQLTWYSGCNDEDYVDGEYVGRENFIY